MKKKTDFLQIRAWKVILFSILTFGIFSIVLLSIQRARLPDEKPRFTHWGYLVAIVWLMFLGVFAIMAIAPFLFKNTYTAAVFATAGTYVWAFLLCCCLAFWQVRIIAAVNKVMGVKMPTWQLAVSSFFLGPLVIAFEQSVINRRGKARQKQAGQLMYVMVCTILIGGALVVLPEIMSPAQSMVKDTQQLYDGVKEDVRLYAEYEKCTADLDEKYPQEEIPEDVFDEYSKEFDACEEVYQEYLKPKY